MKRFISVILCIFMMLSLCAVSFASVSAADTITYNFAKTDAGFAEGTITLTAANGSYYLYWADNEKALSGMDTLGKVTVSSGKGTLTMPKQTAIPADAEKLIAIKASTEPTSLANCTVAKAAAVYNIPTSKQLSFDSADALYTFGAISDPQLANDSYGEGRYPHDETHLAAAFETLAKRGVDFTVSSGDTVNDQNGKQTFATEYKRYQKILADSSYVMPIYEANGNHDVEVVWKGSTTTVSDAFIKGTGLNSEIDTLMQGTPYYEITEPTTGDHFIFMALEGAFYTDENTQFSTAQLDWLEGLLKKYSTDGKNIFIIEHANVAGWGSGDKATSPYYYDLGLIKTNSDVKRFIKLMETYKECVIITGHTHLELSAQLNYSDNSGTSAVMMHNSAIGGVRRLIDGKINRDPVLGLSEGYIVEVYEDCILFNGINMYQNEVMPLCSYIIPFDTEELSPKPTEPTNPTETEPTVTDPSETEPVKTEPSETEPKPTETEPSETQAKPTETEPDKSEPTTSTNPTEPEVYLYGDADLNEAVNVKDASIIQKYVAKSVELEGKALIQANVTGDNAVNVRDATAIQKKVANMIDRFPIEEKNLAPVGADLSTILATVASELEKNYQFSSFDQYQALKKAYSENKGTAVSTATANKLEALLEELYAVMDAVNSNSTTTPGDSTVTVYFTNNKNWDKVYAYVWNDSGSKTAWPGEPMTFVKTNDLGEDIYSITYSAEYDNIIFNNNDGVQTVDISINPDDGIVAYYLDSNSSGKWSVKTYNYS